MLRTHGLFPDGLDYSLHVPFVLNKRKFLALADEFDLSKGYLLRSVYGNRWDIGGEEAEDVKAYSDSNIPTTARGAFLSSDDSTINVLALRTLLNRMFPEPCEYEAFLTPSHMERIEVTFTKNVYPYKKGQRGMIREDMARGHLKDCVEIVAEKPVEKKPEVSEKPKRVYKRKSEKSQEPKSNKSMAGRKKTTKSA